jgi:hypothetical protein
MRVTLTENGEFRYEDFGSFSFVPLLKGTAQDR